jgi:hypothetical protein
MSKAAYSGLACGSRCANKATASASNTSHFSWQGGRTRTVLDKTTTLYALSACDKLVAKRYPRPPPPATAIRIIVTCGLERANTVPGRPSVDEAGHEGRAADIKYHGGGQECDKDMQCATRLGFPRLCCGVQCGPRIRQSRPIVGMFYSYQSGTVRMSMKEKKQRQAVSPLIGCRM